METKPQDLMKEKLAQAGIPSKETKVYGSQVMITVKGYRTAARWRALLLQVCKSVSGPVESWEAVKKQDEGMYRPKREKVWRVHGTL